MEQVSEGSTDFNFGCVNEINLRYLKVNLNKVVVI